MSLTKVDVLLEEAAAFIAVAESGDASASALEQAAIRIDAAMKANPALTQREIGERIGKSRTYVNLLLQALSRARDKKVKFEVDWKRGKHGTNGELQKMATDEPEKLVAALAQAAEQAPKAEREKIVKAVTDTNTVLGRHVENKVRADVKKEKVEKPKPEEPITGIPLSAAWSGISIEIDKWARGLSQFDDDLIEQLVASNPDGAEKILEVVERLEEQVARLLRGLRGQHGIPELEIIEGGRKAS